MEVEEEEQGEGSASSLNSSSENRTSEPSKRSLNQTEIFKALEVIERDSVAIANSFSSLRFALSHVEYNSLGVSHIRMFVEEATEVQEGEILESP